MAHLLRFVKGLADDPPDKMKNAHHLVEDAWHVLINGLTFWLLLMDLLSYSVEGTAVHQ